MLRGISLDLEGGQLSDLFFNYEHPARDRLYTAGKQQEIDPGELHAAIVDDAKEFLTVLGIDSADFAAELAADFERRV
jgi:hypothetical protein